MAAASSAYRTVVDVLVTGGLLIVPLVVTVYLLVAIFDVLVSALGPFMEMMQLTGIPQVLEGFIVLNVLVELGIYEDAIGLLSEFVAFVLLVAIVGTVGVVARVRYGREVISLLNATVEAIPGVGTVYESFRRLSETLIRGSSEQFTGVKLVEFPDRELYVLGFETGDSPPEVREAARDGEVVSLFLPLAPNPITGGFLTYVPVDRVHEIDMTVDEAVRALVTSGVATDEPGDDVRRLGRRDLHP